MPSRDELIAAKGEVQARLARVRRDLQAAQAQLEGATGLRRRFLMRRVSALEATVEHLTAEEMRLRLEIDRSPRL